MEWKASEDRGRDLGLEGESMQGEEVRLILLSLVCVPLWNVIFTDEEKVISERLGEDIFLSNAERTSKSMK